MHAKYHERGSRGRTQMGWLNSYHTFSFGHFMDPSRMGFRSLRVINDDYVAGGSGFPTHPHDNMEIITFVLDGALEHKDSMGNGSVIKAGDIQKMSAGSGITHSEFNPSSDETCHLYQIWIRPDTANITPAYEQISTNDNPAKGLRLVGSREGGEGQISIHQDVNLYHADLSDGETISHDFDENRYGFLQVLSGAIELKGETFKEGDGLEFSKTSALDFTAKADSKIILFDMG